MFDNVNLWYRISVAFVCFGVSIQALAEPLVVFCLIKKEAVQRTKIEGFSSIGRSIFIGILLFLVNFRLSAASFSSNVRLSIGLLIFSFGHIVYSFIWFFLFWLTYRKTSEMVQKHSGFLSLSLYPRSIRSLTQSLQFSNQHKQILPSFLILACEKILLNELDKLIVVSLISFDAWGTYALISNLGSVVCRLILSPIEELATVAFSTAPDGFTISHSISENSLTSGEYEIITKKLHLSVLATYIGCECFAGALGLALCSPISATILYIFYGSKWVSNGSHLVLQTYD